MPILHMQLAGQAQTPDGKTILVPPQAVLLQMGPRVQVTVSVAKAMADQLIQSGKPVPQPISGLGLIDTGATATSIDEAAAQRLQLPVVDVVSIASASESSVPRNVYPLHVDIVGLPVGIDAPRAVGLPLAGQQILVLLGRDVLNQSVLVYNGMAGQFTLAL